MLKGPHCEASQRGCFHLPTANRQSHRSGPLIPYAPSYPSAVVPAYMLQHPAVAAQAKPKRSQKRSEPTAAHSAALTVTWAQAAKHQVHDRPHCGTLETDLESVLDGLFGGQSGS
eukprot:CAMPEP_0197662752 /NCGR_PEP_ID=MMETSP1338-20131121/54633_1 /TAXON_ID=43686 ORGANISM="Pelagodinium beii, Strain RCC1491" /NCGR_SAMPLE_ID=MMETSP1338 /ASSEMBLY_ACC=CAM_ASM_000754 /LENGTH=114 /DNA_ID=CAMNT_0043240731 /DNA_START=151 /DNA_END=495 /DNA_ORIENTATION=-